MDAALTLKAGTEVMILEDAYELIKSEYQRMVGFVRSRLSDSQHRDAEDVVQDVLTSVVDKLNVAAPLEDLTAYLYRGLRNRIVDIFRRRKNTVSLDAPIEGSEETLKDLLTDLTHNPEQQFSAKEAASELYRAMGKLHSDERAIVLAIEFDGATFAECSEEWGDSINTLLSRKARAMKKLKKLLKV